MDPALRELVRRGGDPDDEVPVILRLVEPDHAPAAVRLVARFGDVATARIRRSDILAVWSDVATRSVKAPRLYAPDLESVESAGELDDLDHVVDQRRPPGLSETGRGVVVGVVDWGCDFAHPDLRGPDGSTRLLGLWDQRPSERVPPAPYGYGRAFESSDLDRALAAGDPYAALGYHPADFDAGLGAHGTHTLSIAAGNGRGGGPAGMAPGADCVFVNLGKQQGSGAVPLGSSVELLEAVDFIVRVAGDRALVVNASLGRHAGMHTGRTLVERALDHLVSARPGTAVTQSAGNYFERRTHGAWQLHPGEQRRFSVDVDPHDRTPNEIDLWYPGRDRLTVVVSCPALGRSARVSRGAQATLQHEGRDVARIYHRAFDPNSGDNQCSIVVQPDEAAPRWEITLVAEDVVDGRVHAWIERDSGCRACQSRLDAEEAVPQTTTGTIANGFRTLVVGAVDGHRAEPRIARFSSSGPTRDGRQKPDLLAPGVMVLGARSHPAGPRRTDLYVRMSGTSMAAPAVAGAVALLFERHGRLAIEETRRAVLAGCRPIGADADPRRTGAGLLDVRAALDAAHSTSEGETTMTEPLRTAADGAAGLPDGWDVTETAPFRNVKVAVVGGGLSGLMAARTLAEGQFGVTLFEASERLGGRVWTRTDLAPGRTVEAGAELIGRNHPLWNRLAAGFGLTLQEVTSEESYRRSGLRVRWRYGGRDLTAAERAAIQGRLAPVLDLIGREAATVDRLRPWVSPRAAEWDRISVAQRLRRSDMFGTARSDALRHLEFVLANDQCAATEHQSYLGLLAAVSAHRLGTDLGGYWKHTEDFRCRGGSQQLAQRLGGSVRRILLSTPVDTLEIRAGSVRVAFSRDRACTFEDFDFVVLATPPTVWPVVVSDPAFPARDYTMAHGPAVKYLSAVRSSFWLRSGLAPSALWDELGSVWESTDGQQPRTRGPFGLSVYAGGPVVRPGGDYAARLEILYPGFTREATRRELVDWPARAYCRTGYSVPAPGQVTTVAQNLSRPFRDRLFFAGEQASPGFFGYMEGALQAGLRAAQQVVVAAVRSAPAAAGRTTEAADAAPVEEAVRELVTVGTASGPPPSSRPDPLGDGAGDWSDATPCTPAPEPGPPGGPPHPLLRKGASRPVVGHAQQCLNVFLARHQAGTLVCPVTTPAAAAYVARQVAAIRAAGQLPLGVDCRFGDNTDRAVRAVQTCFGLGVDGEVGKHTWPVLTTFAPGGGGAVTPTGTVFRMLLDTKRDGTLAPAGAGWQWGSTGRGAVVLVNNDDDGATGRPDNEDRVIDTGNDAAELATLVIEATSPVPVGTVVELEVSDPRSLRVFGAATPGAAEIIGPHAGARHLFVTVLSSRRELRMEGLRYARRGFSGEVTLTLRATVPLRPTETHTATVRVAPWMMPSHLDPAERVYVADTGPFNDRFRRELGTLVAAAGCTLVEVPATDDDWMQDCMEFGFATVPGRTLRTVLPSPQDRPLRTVPRGLMGPDLGYGEEGSVAVSTGFDSTGNLECTPPVTVGARRYPWGRIYYGRDRSVVDDLDHQFREFLVGQEVQRPIELDTGWLTVGHVDEVISFVPAPGDPGFRLLIASPKRAYALLDRLARRSGAARMLAGRSLRAKQLDPAQVRRCVDPSLVPAFPATFGVERTVAQFLALTDDFHPELKALYFVRAKCRRTPRVPATLRRYNAGIQTHLDRMRARLQAELGLPESAVVEIPAVFMPNPRTPSLADALVPGMVNMLVVNGHCIVPKPFGPVVGGVDQLEEDVRGQLTGLGLTVSFLDCWEEYHVRLGEVHCATNTLRKGRPAAWWEVRP